MPRMRIFSGEGAGINMKVPLSAKKVGCDYLVFEKRELLGKGTWRISSYLDRTRTSPTITIYVKGSRYIFLCI